MKSAALQHQHHRSPAGSTRGSVCRRLTEHVYHGEGASAHTQTHTVSHTHTHVECSTISPVPSWQSVLYRHCWVELQLRLHFTGHWTLQAFLSRTFPQIATAAISSQLEHGNFLHPRRVRLGICAVSCTLSPSTSSGQLPAGFFSFKTLNIFRFPTGAECRRKYWKWMDIYISFPILTSCVLRVHNLLVFNLETGTDLQNSARLDLWLARLTAVTPTECRRSHFRLAVRNLFQINFVKLIQLHVFFTNKTKQKLPFKLLDF